MAQTAGGGQGRLRGRKFSSQSVENVFPTVRRRGILGRYYVGMTASPAIVHGEGPLQQEVNRLFTENSTYWGAVYRPDDHSFAATVHRARQAAAVSWIDA